MMQQYKETKAQYPDCILFYRLGDFYELFFEDALTASRVLELTLTGKDCGLEERAPMCGVPYHAVDSYLNKMVSHGYKVAIAEQMEDPKEAKGIVKREVIRVVTPGTNTAENALDETRNNFLCTIYYAGFKYGICFADITTGTFKVTETDSSRGLTDELAKYNPIEMLCNKEFRVSGVELDAEELDDSCFGDPACQRILREHFGTFNIESLGLKDTPCGMIAAGACLRYIYDTQKHSCSNITAIEVYSSDDYLMIDSGSRRNLELTETMRNKEKRGSLFWVLDRTGTAMGARLLRSWIEQPLNRVDKINARLDAVEELHNDYISRAELREYINPVYDLERLMGRISSGLANPRDLIALMASLEMLPHIRAVLSNFHTPLLTQIRETIDPLEDIHNLIFSAICEEPPVTVREGGIIKTGYHPEIDRLRSARTEGKKWLADLESRERERTGIKSLRVRYSKVFGYCIEITNTYKDMVPEEYIRKQTLVNCERYTTGELKELEEDILGAEDRLVSLEYELFTELKEKISAHVGRIQTTAEALAQADVLASLAEAAYKYGYVRPQLNDNNLIRITGGRHPVVERMISGNSFIPNDTLLDSKNNRFSIITGPNMAGKSTYMRQVALIVLMAQMGSFVPADKADIGICDRIFTRVGASDDLGAGQSTFMVEMTEVANILRCATRNSLIIMDEIGRGTSTFDGLSIAWAVVEYISSRKVLGARTLFATHYHELTELEGSIEGVQNYCIAVKEQGDDIVFLRKIVKGGADKSYGIQVAKLAGVPDPVISRAKELSARLSSADINLKTEQPDDYGQLSIFDTVRDDDIINEIKELNLGNVTPLEAINILYGLKSKVDNRI